MAIYYIGKSQREIENISIFAGSETIFGMNEEENYLSELDIYLAEKRRKEQEVEEEFNIIDNLDKTTVLKLDNLQEYVVSPMKKNRKEEKEETKDYKFFLGYEKFLEDNDNG